MSQLEFDMIRLDRRLHHSGVLSEALFFPQSCRFGQRVETVREAVHNAVRNRMRDLQGMAIQRLARPLEPEVVPVEIEIKPPQQTSSWQTPLTLTLYAICWQHLEELAVAFFPELEIEVLATDGAELRRRLQPEAEAALKRNHATRSLYKLWPFGLTKELAITSTTLCLERPTPREVMRQLYQEQKEKRPTILSQLAKELKPNQQKEAFRVDGIVEQLADALNTKQRRSLLLVGPSGVGKTAIYLELIRTRQRWGLDAVDFWATSGARLVAGVAGTFGGWQENCRGLVQELSKTGGILHIGSLFELMNVGQSMQNQQSIAAFLRPYLVRGEIVLLAECTPEQYPLIEREDPYLLAAFVKIDLTEPEPAVAREILELESQRIGNRFRVQITTDGIDVLDRLHRRYTTYSAYPGRPLRFLRQRLEELAVTTQTELFEIPDASQVVPVSADTPFEEFATATAKENANQAMLVTATANPERLTVTAEGVIAAFSQETGLPLKMLDPEVPLSLPETLAWFHQRVIGQEEAVSLVVDLLAMVKSALSRPGRPIASLLFVGPTGVGKTEMAKALAEFLFSSPDRMTRLDMSEYQDVIALQRLTGGLFGQAGILTTKVREQPFGVLLFDEVEKAHPQFFDLLLQILGEARLTDAAGRLANFANTVIIMTSNLGAESFMQGGVGFIGPSADANLAKDHFLQVAKETFRPELVNRLDRIIPFLPLSAAAIRQVTERQLDLMQRREGIQYRGIQLTVTPAILDWLAKRGFDPRYGARPLKRAMERELLAPLAEKVNQYAENIALEVHVEASVEPRSAAPLTIQTRARLNERGQQVSRIDTAGELAGAVRQLSRVRREILTFLESPRYLKLKNEIAHLQRLESKRQHQTAKKSARNPSGKEKQKGKFSSRKQLSYLVKQQQLLLKLRDRIQADEEEGLLTLFGNSVVSSDLLRSALQDNKAEWDKLLLDFLCDTYAIPDKLILALFSFSHPALLELAEMYQAWLTHYATQIPTDAKPTVAVLEMGEINITVGAHQSKVAPWVEIKRELPRTNEEKEEGDRGAKSNVPLRDPAQRRRLWYQPIADANLFFQQTDHAVFGILFILQGPRLYPLLEGEAGLHRIKHGDLEWSPCLVDIALPDPPPRYQAPNGIEYPNAIGTQDQRRYYHYIGPDLTLTETSDDEYEELDDEGQPLAPDVGRLAGAAKNLPSLLHQQLMARLRRRTRQLLFEEETGSKKKSGDRPI